MSILRSVVLPPAGREPPLQPVLTPRAPADQLHSVPIAQMGNYQDFLKAAPQPLRDADPEQPKRLHTFGNPFKLDKKVPPPLQPLSPHLAPLIYPEPPLSLRA